MTKMYRIRGENPYTGRDVFATTCWYRDIEDAKQTERIFKSDDRWKNVRIVEMDIEEYQRIHQKNPKFC